jgi:hypothetical protein
LVGVLEETAKCLELSEKIVEPSLDLVVNRAAEDGVLLSHNLSEMAQLVDLV